MLGIKADNQNQEASLPELRDVIEDIGLGNAQFLANLLGAGLFVADGSEMLAIGSVMTTLQQEWNLSPTTKGSLVGLVFVGVLIGNLLSGTAGDTFGRRQAVLLSYAGLFVFNIICSFADSLAILSLSRVGLGVAIGIGLPAWITLSSEITPSYWRYQMLSISMASFTIGELLVCLFMLLDDPSMKALHWRWLFLAASVLPLLLFFFAGLLLQQSPSWLALNGQYEEAIHTLESMRDMNGQKGVSVLFKIPSKPVASRSCTESLVQQWSVLFAHRLVSTTAIVMYTCFVMNFTYYGSAYAFPQIFSAMPESNSSSAVMQLMIGCLWELPGNFLPLLFGTTLGRKTAMKLIVGMTLLSLILFITGSSGRNNLSPSIMANLGYWGIKCFPNAMFVTSYQYAAEVYPTEARVSGTAVNIAGGRVAGMIAPLCFEYLIQTPLLFFWIIAALNFVNFALLYLLPYETMAAKLYDREDEHDAGENQHYGATGSAPK